MIFKIGAIGWSRVAGWIARVILIFFIALAVENWLDILVFRPEEYERLVGSEAGCGVVKAYCSWQAFLRDDVPFVALAMFSIIVLVSRGLPRREWIIRALAVVICGYLAWRAYEAHLETMGLAAIMNARVGHGLNRNGP